MKTKTSVYYQTFAFAYILVAIIFCGCHEMNTPKKNSGFVLIDTYNPLTVVEVDSCEYLLGEWGSATILTHKGNCKLCEERRKK